MLKDSTARIKEYYLLLVKLNSIPFDKRLFSQRVSTGCILESLRGTFKRYMYPRSTSGQRDQNCWGLDSGRMLLQSFQSDFDVQPWLRSTELAISMLKVLDEICVSCQKRTHSSHLSYPTILLLAYSTPVTLALNTVRTLLPQGLCSYCPPFYTALLFSRITPP